MRNYANPKLKLLYLKQFFEECTDDLNRVIEDMDACAEDTSLALARIADNEDFFETAAGYGKDMVTGFLRLNGQTVGAVANRSEVYGEDGEKKELSANADEQYKKALADWEAKVAAAPEAEKANLQKQKPRRRLTYASFFSGSFFSASRRFFSLEAAIKSMRRS